MLQVDFKDSKKFKIKRVHMRSYYEHLVHVQNRENLIDKKPVFRASALFPAYLTTEISTRYLFLGYWMIKKNIHSLTCLITLRSQKGNVLFRKKETIQDAKAYRIELIELIEESQLIESNELISLPFIGSVEIEFYSDQPLVYPFPAVSINFYGKHFSSVVHTAQRVYNDYSDMLMNEKLHVAESGFNILLSQQQQPYLTLINGPKAEKNFEIEYQFINQKEETLNLKHIIEELAPYETRFLYPAQTPNLHLDQFLEEAPGTLKINFNLSWVYSRLIVGTLDTAIPALSVTHTYYDCSQTMQPSDYWLDLNPDYHSATLLLPVFVKENYFTKITFYPIYSPSNTEIDLQVLDHKGNVLLERRNIIQLEHSIGNFISLDINELCSDLPKNQAFSVSLIAKTSDGSKIPARIKVSLDIGHFNQGIASNICTNLVPFNPKLTDKSTTFRWMPILADRPKASCWIMNNSPKKKDPPEADLVLTFYREKDAELLQKSLSIPPKGFIEISTELDSELEAFLNNTIGWCTIHSSNPYINTYYLSDNESGVIGGDHGY